LIDYLGQTTGKICGRFTKDQLAQPLVAAKHGKKQRWWVALVLPLSLWWSNAGAQAKKTAPVEWAAGAANVVKGDTIAQRFLPVTITGKITDQNGVALPFVAVNIIETGGKTLSDSTGAFSIQVNLLQKSITIEASATGIGSVRKKISIRSKKKIAVHLTIDNAEIILGGLGIIRKPSFFTKFTSFLFQKEHPENV
jgi:hypothetical protein